MQPGLARASEHEQHGRVAGATEQIEVVVLREGEDVLPERAAEWRAPRSASSRLLQAAATLLVMLAVLAGPVLVPSPVVERAGAPTPRSSDGPCPAPAGRHLWCSFIDDPACCPPAEAGEAPAAVPSGSRPA